MSIMAFASILMVFAYVSYSISTRDSSSDLVNTPNFSNAATDSGAVYAGIASTMDLIFGSPRFWASATHSSEYPFPLNTILWCSMAYFLIRSCAASSKSSAFSRTSQASENASATMVFNTIFACATESWEPTIRNSNLFPVKANGDVRLRSVASFMKSGMVLTPVSSFSPSRLCVAVPVLISWFNTSPSWSPR